MIEKSEKRYDKIQKIVRKASHSEDWTQSYKAVHEASEMEQKLEKHKETEYKCLNKTFSIKY